MRATQSLNGSIFAAGYDPGRPQAIGRRAAAFSPRGGRFLRGRQGDRAGRVDPPSRRPRRGRGGHLASVEAACWRVPGLTGRTRTPFWADVLYFVALFHLCLHEIATITTKCTEKPHEYPDFAVNAGETEVLAGSGANLSGVGALGPSRSPSPSSPSGLGPPSGSSPVPHPPLLSRPLLGVVGQISQRFPALFGPKAQRHLAGAPRSRIFSARYHMLHYLSHSSR